LLKIEGHRALRDFISKFSEDFRRIVVSQKVQNFGNIFHSGIFEPLRDEADFKTTHKRVHHSENLEKYGTEFLSKLPENLHAFLCKNSSSLLGGFFYPQDLYFNCGYLLDNLEIVLRHLGVVFFEKRINSFETNGYDLVFRGNFQDIHSLSRHVVLCTGAKTLKLLQSSRFFDQNLGEFGRDLSTQLGQKLNAVQKFGKKPNDASKEMDLQACIKKNSYGFLRTHDFNSLHTQFEFQSPKNWNPEASIEELLSSYSRECLLDFTRENPFIASLSFEWMKAERLRTKSRMPWVETIFKTDNPNGSPSFVHVATAMHKSGYQLFWTVAEQVLNKIKTSL
jgi:hypothetical protein